MTQKCIATRVVGNGNWEDFQWPHSGNRIDEGVHDMLQSLNLMEYSEVFQREQLSLDDIKDMDKEDLKLIGISRHKQRQAILKFFSDRSSEEQKADGEQVKQRKLQKETEEQRKRRVAVKEAPEFTSWNKS